MFQNMNRLQKVVLCKDLRYADCLTRMMISKKINCARVLIVSAFFLQHYCFITNNIHIFSRCIFFHLNWEGVVEVKYWKTWSCVLQESGVAIPADDAKVMVDVRSCRTWSRDKWNITLENFPEILNPECLWAAPTDILLDK